MLEKLLERFTPNPERAVSQMHETSDRPAPRLPGDHRSELLVVGEFGAGGELKLYENFVYYRMLDDVWVDDKTEQPVGMPITHWINASEQDKLF